jgi:DNA-binding transcriptional MerR regulator
MVKAFDGYMFKIGDFSKISQVSVKTLHHYDDIGLLKPAAIDPVTGYRHYMIEQLPRLNRILALKDLGFTLEQIARLLDDHLSFEAICAIMHMKQAELTQRVTEEQARLARVAARLRLIQQEGSMSNYEVVIRTISPCTVVSMREVMPNIPHMGWRIGEVVEALERQNIRPTGSLMTLFYHSGFREEGLDIEVAVPVPADTTLDVALSGNVRLGMRTLPAVERMACLVYQGSYETLSEAYAAFGRWMAEHGYQLQLPGREIYLNGPHNGPPITEIQFPLG